MKRIKLTQGQFVLVDDNDYDWLNQWKWHAAKSRNTSYAATSHHPAIAMHRLILGLKYGDKKFSDHIDGDGLNNQRFNLRICTNQQNGFNRRKYKAKSSIYKGVSWITSRGKWEAATKKNGKNVWIGHFDSEILAAKAYDKKARELFGEFARLNLSREI